MQRGAGWLIRAIVVDDEPPARLNVTALLRRDPQIEIVAECGSGAEALASIRREKPDLVFLDVAMPECDGFDVLELLGTEVPVAVIFLTAYDSYAIRAFEAGALDYLLKPFDDARFALALTRAKDRIVLARNGSPPSTSLVVKTGGSLAIFKVAEIDWIEAADYYSRIHIGTRSHLMRRSLAELEEELDRALFFRIHRSTIVRLECIRGLEIAESGEYDVLLATGRRLRVSRRYRKRLQEMLPTSA
jgi:two-component system LytT family response regulator